MPHSYAQNWWVVRTFGKQQYLLLSLVVLLVLVPLLTDPGASPMWQVAVLTLIMLTGPLSLAVRRFDFFASLGLGAVMATSAWLGAFVQHDLIGVIDRASTVLFFLMLGGLIFRYYLFTQDEVGRETLIAAVNAYLCVGIMYAFAYLYAIEYNPDAFAGAFIDGLGDRPQFSTFVYLSFVTMTTLGYGDITPKSEIAAILTYSQALVGQLFMALTVARIVGIMVAKQASAPP